MFKYLLFLCIVLKCVNSARILGIFWTSSQSHHIVAAPLLQALAKKGHEVHLMSTFNDKVNISGYKQTLLTGIFEFPPVSEMALNTPNKILNHVFNLPSEIEEIAENFWKNKAVEELIETMPVYDAIIILAHHTDHIYPIAKFLSAPLILFIPASTNLLDNKYVGNPNLPYYTQPAVDDHPESFIGRLSFFSFNVLMAIADKYFLTDLHEKITRQYLPIASELSDVNVSLILVNSHHSIELPRPYVPNMVPIGGYNIFEAAKKPIPRKFRDFLDSAKDGAIIFSLGTNPKAPTTYDFEDVISSFGKLFIYYKFLVRWESPIRPIPDNVMVVDWIPDQGSILGHPNVKLFITHGGLDGMTEAIYHGLPILGIPYTGEEKSNVNFAVQHGFGMRLNHEEIVEHTMTSCILSLLQVEPSYVENAKKRSALFRNRPVHPMRLATWWVEHIIEHKGGEHLKNVVVDFQWYKVYMLDIVAFYVMLCAGTILLYVVVVNYMAVKEPTRCPEPEEPASSEDEGAAGPGAANRKKGKKPKRN